MRTRAWQGFLVVGALISGAALGDARYPAAADGLCLAHYPLFVAGVEQPRLLPR